MSGRITVADIEYIREELLDIFPDAVRGSVSKSRWGNGKRELHLSYFIQSDTVGGYKLLPDGNLYQLIAWDTNCGIEWKYCCQDRFEFIAWVRGYFDDQRYGIERTVEM